jgi:outer membrane protein assembly factor BamB
VAQFGDEKRGGIAAYELDGGKEKWKWTEEGTAYASPVVMTVGGTKMLVAETSASVVGISLDGKTLWKVGFVGPGRLDYNASTPLVDGETVIFSGVNRGTKAIKVEKKGDTFVAKELWSAPKEYGAKFNTPVLKDGVVYGLSSGDSLFSLNAASGKAGWSESFKGRGGYGSIVDAGSVLLALTPVGQLVVYAPSETEFKVLTRYTVASGDAYAYPIATGNRIYIKDKTSVILYTVD